MAYSKDKGNLLEKAASFWVFGRWKAPDFYGGYGTRTCAGTFLLQHNILFYLLPLKKEKMSERGLLLPVMGYGEELAPNGGDHPLLLGRAWFSCG